MNKFFIMFLFSLSLYAQDFSYNKETGKAVPQFVGELKLMRGRALKTTGGRPRLVKTGDRFFPKDIVATEDNSSMKILISDDTWLSVGPNSEIVFTEFDFRDKDDRDIGYELKKGQISANVRQKIKKGKVEFRSMYSSIGVRGTKIMMNYREMKGVGITEYALLEGKADVTDSKGKIHEIKAGQRIVLLNDKKKDEPLMEQMELSPADLESFISPEADEDKDIRPFMPYYEPKAETVSSTNAGEGTAERKKESTTSGDGSFQNLKKLNEQLKDNQKKRKR